MMRLSTLTILALLPFVFLYFAGEVRLRMMSQSSPLLNSVHEMSVDQIPDMTGKVVVVTGGNAGLGFESAREFAKKGATVIIGCRDARKGREAVEAIKAATGKQVEYIPLELSQFNSIRSFAKTFQAKYDKLDVLLLNAGKFFDTLTLGDGNFEANMGIHHVGHAYLTFLLFPTLRKTKPSRIVVVSSEVHGQCSKMDYDSFVSPKSYSSFGHYAQSKLANIYFTRRLASELQRNGIHDIFVNVLHPGFVITDFSWFQATSIGKKLGFDAIDGALTQIYVASHPDIVDKHITGEYFNPVAGRGAWGWNTSPATLDWNEIDKFWTWTLETLKKIDPALNLKF